MSLVDSLWPLAKREGLRSAEELAKLDLAQIQTSTDGRPIVPPHFFAQERAKHPDAFKSAREMSPAERQDFVAGVKSDHAAAINQRPVPLPPVKQKESDPHNPAQRRSV